MISSVRAHDYSFQFPLSKRGLKDGCEKLKKTLVETKGRANIGISIIFNSNDFPEQVFSVEFKRTILNELTFKGLNDSQIKYVKTVFYDLGISINRENNLGGKVTKTPEGGTIVGGDVVSCVGLKIDLASFRVMFPGKTDEELMKMFGS